MVLKARYRLGIDVGGTHTDAAILDENLRCVVAAKSPTSEDVYGGILSVIEQVMVRSGVAPEHIRYAMLGTTQCTNAVVSRHGLNRVGLLRLSLPSSDGVPPLWGWDAAWQAIVGEHLYQLHGGYEVDGREIHPLIYEEVMTACEKMRGRVDCIAICGVFAPSNAAQEHQVARWVSEALPGTVLSLSHRIGNIGLLERENATVLNAALHTTADCFVNGFIDALGHHGISAMPYFGQNDGTLLSMEAVKRYPILTMACGPTNSLRGACHLSGLKEALVIDVGGTTTDIGVLTNGFPRESALAVNIGGIRTHFRMPDILSIGIGGGTLVSETIDGEILMGPDSVGYRLLQQATSFGGDRLTLSDVLINCNPMRWSGPQPTVQPTLDAAFCQRVYRTMIATVEEAIDRMKTSVALMPAIVVGGGSILLPDKLKGVSQVIKPANFDAANAIGVALGQISGQIDKVVMMAGRDRASVRDALVKEAIALAEEAGAIQGSMKIIEFLEVPLAYLPGNAVQVKVKAAGNLE